jgi:hypothetical protein
MRSHNSLGSVSAYASSGVAVNHTTDRDTGHTVNPCISEIRYQDSHLLIYDVNVASSGWQFLGHTQDLLPQFFDIRVPSDFALLSASG